MDAVLVAMSCFALLCQEAEIRCGSDEVTVTYLVPNYHVYQELAQASTVLTTGKIHFFFCKIYNLWLKQQPAESLECAFPNMQTVSLFIAYLFIILW